MNKHNAQLDLETIFMAQSGVVVGCYMSGLLIDRILEASEDDYPKPEKSTETSQGWHKKLWRTMLTRVGGHARKQPALDPLR